MNKRTIQEIFDAVIDAKYYPYNSVTIEEGIISTNFMCEALTRVTYHNIITEEERNRAQESIRKYINKLLPEFDKQYLPKEELPPLGRTWRNAGLVPWEMPPIEIQKKLLACYKDWTNRPYLHRKLKKL